MASEKKRLLDNFLSLGALQIVGYIFPLINLPYLSRVLGVDKFGLVFFAFAFMQYFNILTDFGFGLSATREVAINRHNTNNLSNIFSSVSILKMGLVFVSYLILCFCTIFVPKMHNNWIVFHLSFLMVLGNAIYPVWFFQGMERMRYITFLNILAKLIFVVLIFIFIKQESDYVIVPLLNSMGFLISGVIGFMFAIKTFGIKFYFPKLQSLKKQFKYSLDFFISRISVSLYSNTNTVCLGFAGSEYMVGLYVAAEKIYAAINGLKEPFVSALYPYIAKHRDVKLYKKLFWLIIMGTLLISLFGFIFSKPIITIFYGINMQEAYKIFKIFCVLFFVNVPSGLLGYPLLGGMGHTKVCNYSVIIASLSHVVLLIALLLLNKLTIYTMAYLVLFTTFIEFNIRFWAVKKYKLLSVE